MTSKSLRWTRWDDAWLTALSVVLGVGLLGWVLLLSTPLLRKTGQSVDATALFLKTFRLRRKSAAIGDPKSELLEGISWIEAVAA